MDELKLRDKEIFPSDTVLENILGDSYNALKCLLLIVDIFLLRV